MAACALYWNGRPTAAGPSEALAVIATALPATAPSAGEVTELLGALLSTVTVIAAEGAELPTLSVASTRRS